MNTSKSQQAGATLIESLVSLVILAIAVVGMLGVQIRTLVETNASANRTQAMLLVEDLSERIKANPNRFDALSAYADKEVNQTALAGGVDCGSNSCNANQLAQYDMEQWSKAVITHLPSGRAQTFRSETDNRQLGVLIGWKSNEKSDSNDYVEPFKILTSSIKSGVTCWTNHLCHLVYIQP